MRAIAGPLMPQEDYEALAATRATQRRARCARSPTSRTSSARRARASASAATTPRSTSCAPRVPALVVPYATPEEDEQTRRARRLEQLGALKVATHINGDIDALLEFTPTPHDARPRRRRARPRSCCERSLRPYVLKQWRALLGASRRPRSSSPLAELAKPWPIALIVDHLIGDRQAPFDVDMGFLLAIGALILAIAVAESAATYFSGLWMQSAGERITHELRVAVYDHLQRLSLAFHQRTHKGDLLTRVTEDVNDMGELFSDTLGEMLQSALLALGHDRRAAVHRPGAGAVQPRHRAAAGRRQLRLPPQGPRARPQAAPPRGRPGQRRQRDARRDAGRQGVRRRGARVRAHPRPAASSAWASASRSRGCRRASTAPSACCARWPPRS